MFDYCIFDQLPAELLHMLFNYFSASELLFTFYNIDDYVNATLQSYSAYQLDLKSILKSHFRRICRHVHPKQIISLTLSDRNDTPGQSDLFFARFRMEQFTRLRSLTLIEIEFNSLESIFSNLTQLHELRSLSFDAHSIKHTYRPLDLNSHNKLEEINFMLQNTYAQIFPRLNFLYLDGGWVLESIPLPNLLHLKLGHCPIDKLDIITGLAPNLRSLDVCVNSGQMNFEVALLPSRLTRLNLKIQDFPVSMNYMEFLLSNRLYLKYLELHVRGFNDLTDGKRWQILTNSLITFNFKFNVKLLSIEKTLDSFRTSFWLEQKQWFVAYQDECLFSVPYFAPEQISIFYQPPIHSTAPCNSVFYKNVTKIIMNETKTSNKRFTWINILERGRSILPRKLLRTIDLRYVKSLSVLSLDNLQQFTPFEGNIPCVCQLSVTNEITVKEIKKMKNNLYKQIRTLEIKISLENQDHIIEELFRLFPYTEKFIYQSDIQSIALMIRFIDGFKHLLNASFVSLGPLYNQNENVHFNPDLIILKSNRLTYGISICRIYYLPNSRSLFSINWWIEE